MSDEPEPGEYPPTGQGHQPTPLEADAARYRWLAAHVAGDEDNNFILDVALLIDPYNPFETDADIKRAFDLAIDTKIIEDKTP